VPGVGVLGRIVGAPCGKIFIDSEIEGRGNVFRGAAVFVIRNMGVSGLLSKCRMNSANFVSSHYCVLYLSLPQMWN
jgi:hypothetical protein